MSLRFVLLGISVVVLSVLSSVGVSYFLSPRLGYVESNRVLDGFSESIAVRQRFDAEKAKVRAEIKQLEDSLKAATDRVKTEYEKATPARRTELATTLEKRNGDLVRYGRAADERLKAREQELMKPVVDKINGFFEEWGSRQHYDMVFGTMMGGNIVQANKSFNVTARFLADLNDRYRVVTAPEKTDTTARSGSK